MTATLQIETPEPAEPKRRRFPLLFLAVMISIAASLGIYFWPGSQEPRSASKNEGHLPFGPAEQAYASNIQFENISLSRAENFIHQEVTTLSGEMVNSGSLPLRDVELAIVFSDELQQVVLRENRSPFGTGSSPLAPGGRREFEISLEHIPSSWNMQVPQIIVSGIQFADKKE
jgi:hypothetical protein